MATGKALITIRTEEEEPYKLDISVEFFPNFNKDGGNPLCHEVAWNVLDFLADVSDDPEEAIKNAKVTK